MRLHTSLTITPTTSFISINSSPIPHLLSRQETIPHLSFMAFESPNQTDQSHEGRTPTQSLMQSRTKRLSVSKHPCMVYPDQGDDVWMRGTVCRLDCQLRSSTCSISPVLTTETKLMSSSTTSSVLLNGSFKTSQDVSA